MSDIRPYLTAVSKGVKQSPKGAYQVFRSGSTHYAIDPNSGSPIGIGITPADLTNFMQGKGASHRAAMERQAQMLGELQMSKSDAKAAEESMKEGLTEEEYEAQQQAIKEEPQGEEELPEEVEEILFMESK